MKKLFLLIFIGLLLVPSLYSQGFQFYRISPSIVYGDTSAFNVVSTKAILKNTSSTAKSFKLVRIINELPGPTWTTQLCGGGTCYAPSADTIPPRNAPPLTLDPQQVDTIIIYFGGSTPGIGRVVLKAYIDGTPGQFLSDTFRVGLTVSVKKVSTVVEGYELGQNYPNPFNPNTTISFSISKKESVSLVLYDIRGNEVATLIGGAVMDAGKYNYELDAGILGISSGVYFYKITTERFTATKKMMLMK